MELEGDAAITFLAGPGTVRDGVLKSLHVRDFAENPTIELVFDLPDRGMARTVKLELSGIREFAYHYSGDSEHVIELVKCLVTDRGEYYISLDPYDERELFVSENDNDFFKSTAIKLTV
jgi:hypothetical protein